MKTLVVKVPDELLGEVDAAARRRGVPRSSVVRAALRSHLRKKEKRPARGQSVADVVADLIGVVKGAPRDLSYAKKHMRGFGR